MKKLWKSKRFRKNVCKWIIMYVGVMGLFTTVITYSRYMSVLGGTDSARVAKFAITVEPTNCTEILSNCNISDPNSEKETLCEVCSNEELNPTKMNYTFTVDTRQMEVATSVIINFYVNEAFSVIPQSIANQEYVLVELLPDGTKKGVPTKVNSGTVEYTKGINYKAYQIDPALKIEAAGGSLKTYSLSIKYNSNQYYKDINATTSLTKHDIVVVGYSAIQEAKKGV